MNFPTTKGGVWLLDEEQLADWREAYPQLDVESECRRARVWLQANPAKQKTSRGMPRFLVSWFNRALDHRREASQITPQERERAVQWFKAMGRCPHEPRCPDFATCIGVIVRYWREREAGES